MSDPNATSDSEEKRTDRRCRHPGDLSRQMTVNLPASLLDALDDVMLERGGTRSGFIRIAVTAWLERQRDEQPRQNLQD
jgi:hypothetical protein